MAPQGTNQGLWVDIEQVLRESESRAVAGQFSAAIMHEINNPLETISNLAYLVEREVDSPLKSANISHYCKQKWQTSSALPDRH